MLSARLPLCLDFSVGAVPGPAPPFLSRVITDSLVVFSCFAVGLNPQLDLYVWLNTLTVRYRNQTAWSKSPSRGSSSVCSSFLPPFSPSWQNLLGHWNIETPAAALYQVGPLLPTLASRHDYPRFHQESFLVLSNILVIFSPGINQGWSLLCFSLQLCFAFLFTLWINTLP